MEGVEEMLNRAVYYEGEGPSRAVITWSALCTASICVFVCARVLVLLCGVGGGRGGVRLCVHVFMNTALEYEYRECRVFMSMNTREPAYS